MESNKEELLSKALLYCILGFVINYLASAIVLIFAGKFVGFLSSNYQLTKASINTLLMVAVAVLDTLLLLVAIFIFMRKVLPTLYDEDEGALWLKTSLFIVLPGELVRYLFALTDLGFVEGSGKFNLVPACLFELLYLDDPDKYLEIRQNGEYVLADYGFYTLCHALYLAVFLTGAFLICKWIWNKYGKDCMDA